MPIDTILTYRNRTLRTLPGKLLLGPTGARLWADYLDPVPGFRGRIDFIHKLNIPLLFQVTCAGGPEEFTPIESLWQPSVLELRGRAGGVTFTEYKFITWEDQAVSLQRWKNRGAAPVTLILTLPEAFSPDSASFPLNIHGINPLCVFRRDEQFRNGFFVLEPGAEKEFIFGMAVGSGEKDNREKIAAELAALLDTSGGIAALLRRQKEVYGAWFKDVPVFECSDPLLEKTWWYRWFILRHNLARPGQGNFHHALFYEGRSHKMGKNSYKPSGWEFSKFIPLSTPLHLTDGRWYGNPELFKETVRSLCDSMDDRGLFRVLFTDETGAEYANYAGWALYLFNLVHPDPRFINEVLDCFKKNLRGICGAHKSTNDHLQVEWEHNKTGKEYQPSYWYFSGYPDNVKDKSGYTPLKRVDRTVYVYLNALALGRLCEEAGDREAGEFYTLAQNIRKEVLQKMWDGESAFFYDLHHETDEKAWVKNIVGIYPLWAGMTGAGHMGALRHLLDPAVFNTGAPFASVSRECPVFSAGGGWKGNYFKGRNGCIWNGPSWPYTTGIALDALAGRTKEHRLGLDRQFMDLLRAYSLQHFQGGDLSRPYLVEHYNSITGEPISDEVDYNHSFYIDLIVRHVAGIEPDRQGFSVFPCRTGLESFSIKNIRIRGHSIGVSWDSTAPDRPELSIIIDGKEAYTGSGLPESPITFKL